jgi:ATP-dependent exoDNAse (exonuclease V) beta subunit
LHPRLDLAEEITRFQTVLAQPAIRDALSRKQYAGFEPELHHDHPIAHRDHHILMQGRIDRLVLLKQNGDIVGADILDFKTDRLSSNDDKAFDHLAQYYEPQLEAYRRAVQDVYGLSQAAVEARMLFLEAGREWRLGMR